MAAYAALVSLEHVIHNLQNHSRPPITLRKEQAHLLTQKLTFLQEFLQLYNPTLPYSKEADPLEARIAAAAYEAEDAIKSHIFDNLNYNYGENMSLHSLYGALEKVTEDMALIEKEAMEIRETLEFKNQLLQTESTTPADSFGFATSSTANIKSMMVGADDLLLEMKDKLTSSARDLQTIPIVGMGGSGKTTLALNIYQDGLIKEHFDICAWVTISQEYNIPHILVQLLTQLTGGQNRNLSEGELGEMLHKHLFGRKFITILDDMWSLEAWDGVKRYLPNNKNGSRIVITTRLTTLASTLSNSNSLGMKLLDEEDSWDLLSKTVFGEKGCPSGLEKIGKKIGKACKGLPLSIVVVGGLLAKSELTIESWEHMEENLNAIVNLDDGERCLKILYMSYKQLPIHLKPCFLYMGIYHEDCLIRTSKIVKLWVCEGFLKPVSGKIPEVLAREYLRELIGRNLIMIHELGSIGSIKKCKVHDLIRDLCLREARKEGLYKVYPRQKIKDDMVDRIVISGTGTILEIEEIEEVDALWSASPLARSLILTLDYEELPPDHASRLLRMVVTLVDSQSRIKVKPFFNSRSLTFHHGKHWIPSSIRLFWNLRTLNVCYARNEKITAPTDIWHMSHTRYINGDYFYLPNPPPNVKDGIVLRNLQSLGLVYNFRCSEQMVKAIPNIRELRIYYYTAADDDRYCLTNLVRFDKLESLKCSFSRPMTCPINYPKSLTKLYLEGTESQCWDDYGLDKIGALPLLQKLTLTNGCFNERKWETSEGRFRSLKFLYIRFCKGLQVWTSEASHFPRLEQLRLHHMNCLEEIPSDFADISTLRLIEVKGCTDSAIESAKRILEEQEALYGEEDTTLQVQVTLWYYNNRALSSSGSSKFHVR